MSSKLIIEAGHQDGDYKHLQRNLVIALRGREPADTGKIWRAKQSSRMQDYLVTNRDCTDQSYPVNLIDGSMQMTDATKTR
jgi:hypothetical protein